MFCHNCGIQLPFTGEVNFCPECGKGVVNKIVNQLLKREDGLFYELGHERPFSGHFISRYTNEKIKKELHYQDGLADGLSIAWHLTGNKESEGHYQHGKQEGLWTWWNEKGQQIIEKHYQNGLKHGLWADWHDNGQQKVNGNFINGKREGLVTIWDKNGKKTSETRYKNDERAD